ncbi:MAG: oligoendopeptidase F [Candidatus Nanohaloarchaea archaeon]
MVSERDEIDESYKWDLEQLFESDEEWEKNFEKAREEIEELERFEGRVTESAETLKEFLKLREELKRTVTDLNSYASKRYDEDTRRDEYQALKSRASTLASELSSKLSFFEPEVQEAGRERIQELMQQEEELQEYRHFFDDLLRFKPHTRSKEVENVLANLGDVLDAPDTAYKALMNADMTFPVVEDPEGEEVEITQSNFTKLLREEDREFRREVYEKFYDEIEEVSNTVAANFEKNIRRNVKIARIRDFESARKASLFQNNVPEEVYDNLVGTVEDNLDALHRHVELKEKVLDVDDIGHHDLYMPLATSESPEISYGDAKRHVIEAVEPLGEEYQEAMRNGIESGWIDVYENRGKRSGAYSSSTYDSQPYILMNYQDDVSSMYTLAHELGHSMHSYLSKKEQPYIYYNYSIFVAEVASTVNEALLTRHLLESAESEELKRHALSHYLENFTNTLYRQTMFADFEQQVHDEVEEGGALTSESLNQRYSDLKQKFLKPVEMDDEIKKEWMRIPHFYYNFYVYQYATGISAAETLVEKILNEGPEDYLDFIRTGSSEYPLDALKIAGVDMTEPEPVEEAIKRYRQKLERAEDLFRIR